MSEGSEAVKTDAVGRVDSQEFLIMSAMHLKKGIEYAIGQLKAQKVRSEMKLRWMKALTKQAEALVRVVEALNSIGGKSAGDVDLATYLSSVERRIETPAQKARIMRLAAMEFHRVVRQASIRVSDLSFGSKQRASRSRR